MHKKGDLKGRYHKLFRAHPAAILQHGGWQDAACHLRHFVSHTELKLLDERVGLIIGTPYLRGERIILTKHGGGGGEKKLLAVYLWSS